MTGQTVSHYEVLQKLGEGGMGLVYLAKDLKLGRFVALKFLASHLIPSREARARFMQEARVISALNHPNIATIYEVDQTEEGPFLALEYLPGGTLKSRIFNLRSTGQNLSIKQAVEYALQMAEGLSHAHRKGIVHRDVKTANAMLSGEGIVKITDFGLSKFQGGPHLTKTGSRLGTVSYMSPEQAQGQEVDHRSDIFSFGIVLYEMVSGQLPFSGDHDSMVVDRILNATPPPLKPLRPDAPKEFEQIIGNALRKKREERYQRMEEVLADLRPLSRVFESRRSVETSTLPISPVRRRTTSDKIARRWLWPLAAALALVLFVCLSLLAPSVRDRVRHGFSSYRVPKEKQLVVLPFQNVGGDPTNQAFCDGLVETLTSMLTQAEQFHTQLWVVPASEVRKQSITDARAAQQAFGANLVVTGSVQRTGDRVRLTANLVDARALRQLGARVIDTRLEDVSALQDGVVARVADLLDVELKPQAWRLLTAGGTAVSSAYDLYVQGRGYLQRYNKTGNLETAIELFQRAIKQDPNYALAYAGLGEAYFRKYILTNDPQWLEQAQEYNQRTIALNDRLAPAFLNMGLVYKATGQDENAIQAFHRALELDPINADAYRELATAYEATGKMKDAESTYQRAIQLRPNSWLTNTILGVFYYKQSRYNEAEPFFRRVIDLTPDNYLAYSNLGGLYHLMGRYDEAEKTFKRSLAIKPTPSVYSNLGTIYFFQGRYRESVTMNEKAIELGGNKYAYDYIVLGNLADAYRWTPELTEKASETYRRAIQAAQDQLAINPKDAKALSSVALYWAKLSNKEKALTEIAKALRLAPSNTTIGFKSVVVYELAGQRDHALSALDAVLRGGYSIQEIQREPELAQLRQDPRYERLVAARSIGPSSSREITK